MVRVATPCLFEPGRVRHPIAGMTKRDKLAGGGESLIFARLRARASSPFELVDGSLGLRFFEQGKEVPADGYY